MIDWNRVTELRDEVGAEDFDEVVDLFLLEVDEEIETLQSDHTSDTLAQKLHFLKGSAMSLGFAEFSQLCAESEKQIVVEGVDKIDVASLLGSYGASRAHFMEQLPHKLASHNNL